MSNVFENQASIDAHFPPMSPADLHIDFAGGNTGKAGRSTRISERSDLPELSELERARYILYYDSGQLYRQAGTLPYLDGLALFGDDDLVSWDFGCGRGERIIELAKTHHNQLYIGVDIHLRSLEIGAKVAARNGLDNLRFVRAILRLVVTKIPDESASDVAVLFPAPQPNNRHGFDDVLNENLVRNIHRMLFTEGSPFKFASDSEPYFNARMRTIGALSLFACDDSEITHGFGDADALTRYQRLWEAKHIASHQAIMRKILIDNE